MSLREEIIQDFRAQQQGKGGFSSAASVLLFGKGFHALLSYRLQKRLMHLPCIGKILAKIMWYLTSVWTACDISYQANIGGGVCIPHPTGVVIGSRVEIGSGSTIYQNVTLGTKSHEDMSYPKVGVDTFLGAGAVIIGDIRIGDDARVGANSVVMNDVPSNHLAVGVPAVIKAL